MEEEKIWVETRHCLVSTDHNHGNFPKVQNFREVGKPYPFQQHTHNLSENWQLANPSVFLTFDALINNNYS